MMKALISSNCESTCVASWWVWLAPEIAVFCISATVRWRNPVLAACHDWRCLTCASAASLSACSRASCCCMLVVIDGVVVWVRWGLLPSLVHTGGRNWIDVLPITVFELLSVDVVVVVAGGSLYSRRPLIWVRCHWLCDPKRSTWYLVISCSISSSTCGGGGKISLHSDKVV